MLRDILATRLRELMTQRSDLDTQAKIAARAGISQSSVGRILNREVHPGLDVLEAIAGAFGMHPLALVMDPREAGHADAMAVGYQERELLRAWRLLSPSQQHAVMGYVDVATMRAAVLQGASDKGQVFGGLAKTAPEFGPVVSDRPLPAMASAPLARAASRQPDETFEQRIDEQQQRTHTTREARKRRGG